LHKFTRDFQGIGPADSRKLPWRRACNCWISLEDSIHILHQPAMRAKPLRYEKRAIVRATAPQEYGSTAIIAGDETRQYNDVVIRQTSVQRADVKPTRVCVESWPAGSQANVCWADQFCSKSSPRERHRQQQCALLFACADKSSNTVRVSAFVQLLQQPKESVRFSGQCRYDSDDLLPLLNGTKNLVRDARHGIHTGQH
jgi:hypothetical protein